MLMSAGKGMLRFVAWGITLMFTMLIIGIIVLLLVFQHFNRDLPDYGQLENYDPPIVTRLYAGDGRLMAEYATEKRVYVPLSAMPKRLINAFIAAEDKNFYQHTGVDIYGIGRAMLTNIANVGQGKSLVGGSTITQQVVKNFLLTNEKSIERKIKEAILATKISQVYSKDRILELYLNEIYLGLGSYGVAAAALDYFNKSLDELSIEEVALLAALPKAPANYNPRKNYEAAKERRDYVITRMLEDHYITQEEASSAISSPITLRTRDATEVAQAQFFAEEVRRKLAEMYGSNVLYEGGLSVKTTLDPALQKLADHGLRKALIEYDRRRGYRGPVQHLETMDGWRDKLTALAKEPSVYLIEDQKLAVVTAVEDNRAKVSFDNGEGGIVPMSLLKWTRRVLADGVLGPEVRKPKDILKVGDIIMVGPLSEEQRKLVTEAERKLAWDLQQVPEVNGALVVMDPHTGRVLALSGGYAYGGTEFNRATQAKRQPGSSFKPFVYLAGLESGLTPSTILLDAPVELSQGAGLPNWKPENYKGEYLGPSTMRVGLEKSRNTMTVRLAQLIGIDKVLSVAKRFGIYDDAPRHFSVVLGSLETTPLRLVNAYAMLVNGGKKVNASLIERIDDRHGKIIYRRDARNCEGCVLAPDTKKDSELAKVAAPVLPDDRPQVVDPRVAYQVVSMLQGVVQRGTAAKASSLGKVLAGKTGTTNDSMDTWFVGFSPDLVAGVFVGYDKPRTLGRKETGSSVALPAFMSFMKEALADKPNVPFRIPPGIRLMKVDLYSGQPPDPMNPGGGKMITEAFISGAPVWVPGGEAPARNVATSVPGMPGAEGTGNVLEGQVVGGTVLPPRQDSLIVPTGPAPSSAPVVGTGGLY